MFLSLLFALFTAFAGGFGQPSPDVTFDLDWKHGEVTYDWTYWNRDTEKFCDSIASYDDAQGQVRTQARLIEREIDRLNNVRSWSTGILYVMEHPEAPVPDVFAIENRLWSDKTGDPLHSRATIVRRMHNKVLAAETLIAQQAKQDYDNAILNATGREALQDDCRARYRTIAESWMETNAIIADAWSEYAPKLERWAEFNSSPLDLTTL